MNKWKKNSGSRSRPDRNTRVIRCAEMRRKRSDTSLVDPDAYYLAASLRARQMGRMYFVTRNDVLREETEKDEKERERGPMRARPIYRTK